MGYDDLVTRCMKNIGLVVFIVVEVTQVLAISSAHRDGQPIFNTSTIVLVVEFLKFMFSLAGIYQDPAAMEAASKISFGSFLRYSIPGFLYAVNNNIMLFVLTLVAPSVFQLLLNIRVLWTGLVFRVFLGRVITNKQWVALVLLVIGCSLTQYKTEADVAKEAAAAAAHGGHGGAHGDATTGAAAAAAFGLLLTFAYTWISTIAGVVNEVLLKENASLHLANAQLYFFGIIINLSVLVMQGGSASSKGGYWRGWDEPLTWCIAVLMSVNGLLISRIMQKYDNIVKIFCIAGANFAVYFYGVFFDPSKSASSLFILAFALCTVAAYIYQLEKTRLSEEEKKGGGGAGGGSNGIDLANKKREIDTEHRDFKRDTGLLLDKLGTGGGGGGGGGNGLAHAAAGGYDGGSASESEHV